MSEFNLVSQPLRYYTKYLIEMQHFYSDCYITDCGITHAAAAPPSVALCQNRQASTNSYIMRTSRPRGRRAFCQNRQASAHGPRTSSLLTHYLHLLYARRPRRRQLFVRTDKQAPCKQRVSEPSPQLHYAHQPLRPWTPWETFVRTDKQAVIHRLFTVYGKVIHSFAP